MPNPIRRLVELIIDRDSARRSASAAEQSLSRVDRALNRLKKLAVSVGGVLAATFAVRAVVRFGKEAVRVATEADAIWNRLAGTLETVGIRFADVEPEIRGLARAMQDATTVGDEDFAEILQELISTSGDYTRSLQNVGTVVDLAAGKQLEFRTAAQLVGRAMVGQTATLTRYGIVVGEGEDAIEAIRRAFRGMAENEGRSLEGLVSRLSNEWNDFKEAVGSAIIAGAEGESVLERLIAVVRSLTMWVERNSGVFEAAAQTLVDVGRAVGFLWGALDRLAGLLVGSITVAWGKFFGVLANARVNLAETAEAVAFVLDLLGGSRLAERARRFSRTQQTIAEAWRIVGDAAVKAGRDAMAGREQLEQSMSPPTRTAPPPGAAGAGGGGGGEGGGPVSIPEFMPRDVTFPVQQGIRAAAVALSPFSQLMQEQARQFEAISTLSQVLGGDYDALAERAAILEGSMRSLAEQGVGPLDPRMLALRQRLREVQEESRLVQQELEITGFIASTVGSLVAASFGRGIGPLAAAKARQNAILAAEQLALAFAASIGIITAPVAAAHYAAAAKFGAIATAWGALAGATGGFSSPSVGAGTSASRGTGAGGAERAQPAGQELHVYFVGEGFDAVNPRVQQVVRGSIQQFTERAGPNADVRVHRRPRQ